MGSNIMKNSCWVIKVTYLEHNQVNFNEAYWTYENCITAIRKKVKGKAYTMINEYVYKDLDNDIVYEAKLVDIFEEVR